MLRWCTACFEVVYNVVEVHKHHALMLHLVRQDTMVRGGEMVVRLNVRGERFDTVMAAIGSHVSRPVKLEVRCNAL